MDVPPLMPPNPPQQKPPVLEDVFADALPEVEQRQPAWLPQPQQSQTSTQFQPRTTMATPVRPELEQGSGVVMQDDGTSMSPERKRLLLLIGGVSLGVIILGAVFGPAVWGRVFGSKQSDTINNINQVRTITNTTIPTRTNQQVQGQVIDSDGDGLTDAEEQSLGTNTHALDTDNDGLTDKQEVKVYNSDPKKADTDGDSFTDGEEVKHFYNPNGAGKLINVNEAINSFSSTNVNQ